MIERNKKNNDKDMMSEEEIKEAEEDKSEIIFIYLLSSKRTLELP